MDDKKNFATKLEEILDCAISLERLVNSVVTTVGQTYSRNSIATRWCLIQGKKTDPKTGKPISTIHFIPNHFIENILSKNTFTDEDIKCPYSGVIMTDPVIGSNGVTYQRPEIDKFFAKQRLEGKKDDDMKFPDGKSAEFIFSFENVTSCYVKNYAAASFIALYQEHKLEFELNRKQLRKEVKQFDLKLQQADYARFYKQQQKKQQASLPAIQNIPAKSFSKN